MVSPNLSHNSVSLGGARGSLEGSGSPGKGSREVPVSYCGVVLGLFQRSPEVPVEVPSWFPEMLMEVWCGFRGGFR